LESDVAAAAALSRRSERVKIFCNHFSSEKVKEEDGHVFFAYTQRLCKKATMKYLGQKNEDRNRKRTERKKTEQKKKKHETDYFFPIIFIG
jgi:hypothetical protein